MKKTIKKIVAVATGAAMVGATIFGAAAASLSAYPAPFVSNGVADVQFVIGSGATDDYLGVIDIATSLQSESVTETVVNTGGGSSSSVEGGAPVEGSGSEDYLTLNEATSDEELDVQDLPSVLADGVLTDDDGDDENGNAVANNDVKYDQTLTVNDVSVAYDTPEDLDDPVIYLDSYSGDTYTLNVQFDDAVDFTALEDGENLQFGGRVFTVGTDTDDDTLVLFGSETTTFLDLNAPKTVTADGKTYTVEIVGANSDASGGETIILDVNGVRKTVEEGDSVTINDLPIYIKDTFVTNIPTLSASANIFIGSEEIVLEDGDQPVVDDEDLDSYVFNIITGTNMTDVEEMEFVYSMASENEDADRFLPLGEARADPLFGFELNFAGASLTAEDEAKVPFMADDEGKKLALTFTNDDGEELTFELLDEEAFADDILAFATAVNTTAQVTGLSDGDIFIGHNGDRTSIFEITDLDPTDGKVTIKDWSSESEREYDESDSIDETEYSVDDVYISGNTEYVDFAETANNVTAFVLKLEGGAVVAFNDTKISVTEDTADSDESDISDAVLKFNVAWDSDDDQYDVTEGTHTGGVVEQTVDSTDAATGLTEYGTFYTIDENNEHLAVYVPNEADVEYDVFVAPADATVVVSGGSGTVTTQTVNRIAIGSAVKDTDVNVANPAKNLIVVGGPCINVVAAELLGLESGSCGAASGIGQNEAIVQVFDLDNGKVAMLVAGWEATETQAAARAVASGDVADATGDSVTLSVTDSKTYTIQ